MREREREKERERERKKERERLLVDELAHRMTAWPQIKHHTLVLLGGQA
jgi:hypothetical protein